MITKNPQAQKRPNCTLRKSNDDAASILQLQLGATNEGEEVTSEAGAPDAKEQGQKPEDEQAAPSYSVHE